MPYWSNYCLLFYCVSQLLKCFCVTSIECSNAQNLWNKLYLICFSLNAVRVMKKHMCDKTVLKCIQHENYVRLHQKMLDDKFDRIQTSSDIIQHDLASAFLIFELFETSQMFPIPFASAWRSPGRKVVYVAQRMQLVSYPHNSMSVSNSSN